jgi:hypothetical protein
MMMDDSSVLGMAFGSAGVTKVLMCVVTSCRFGCCAMNSLICSSSAVAGDLPEGSLWRTTSNIFAFMEQPAFAKRRFQAEDLSIPRPVLVLPGQLPLQI